MNLNISNPFFLQNEITLKNDQLYIESTVLSRLLGIPYPHLIRMIQVVVSRNRSIHFKLIVNDHGHQLISQFGFQQLAKHIIKHDPSFKPRIKRVNTQFMMKQIEPHHRSNSNY